MINRVAAALALANKLGRNKPCWCGSGIKFKRCHWKREGQEAPKRQEFHDRRRRIYESGACLHPDAGPSKCSGKIIKSHTIQRSGGLSRISRDGQVHTFVKHMGIFDDSTWDPESGPRTLGVRRASTFTGFCNRHDNILFEPIEKRPFNGEPAQIALLAYRAICYQYFHKQRALFASSLRREMDKGFPFHYQYRHPKALRRLR